MNKKPFPIVVNKLKCCLGGREILSDVDLAIERGKFYSIIGPNGSGKTTLLRTIASSLAPVSGEVLIDAVSLTDMKGKELAKKLSYVSQNTNIDFDFNVMDYVLMGRHPYLGILQSEGKKDVEYARKAMDITNTWHLREKNLNEVSGGERQRIVVARALTQDTPIILLDEPISQLDIHHQVELMDTLYDMVKLQGATIVTVLHDLNIASQYSDHVVLIHDGKIAKHGRPEEVMREEVVWDIYHLKVQVLQNPETGRPLIIPLRGARIEKLAI